MSNGLRLAFAGTSELAATILATLLERYCHNVKMVITQPDRPSGRGQKLRYNQVKNLAIKYRLRLQQPLSPQQIDTNGIMGNIDALIVVAYGMLLPESVLKCFRYGGINIHLSLLPRWRGAAPIQRAIQAGDHETGISIIQMDSGLDTGPVLLQKSIPIKKNANATNLYEHLANDSSECLFIVLEKLAVGTLRQFPQNDSEATYARKIGKAEARIDWSQSAINIERMIRAFNPIPVAYTELKGIKMRVWRAALLTQQSALPPGTIANCDKAGIDVVTGQGIIRILELQTPGKRVMTAQDFLNGHSRFAA